MLSARGSDPGSPGSESEVGIVQALTTVFNIDRTTYTEGGCWAYDDMIDRGYEDVEYMLKVTGHIMDGLTEPRKSNREFTINEWDYYAALFLVYFGERINADTGLDTEHVVYQNIDELFKRLERPQSPPAYNFYCDDTWLELLDRDQPNPENPKLTIRQSYRKRLRRSLGISS
ncbi:hypothetical protein LTR56_027694 [Elasticomyces elasticus]|nr:hypothetical protein LTR56_027694 [Elasticomyces elasticus]